MVETDIAGDKKILRDRSAVRTFFEREHLAAGSLITIKPTGAYSVTVRRAVPGETLSAAVCDAAVRERLHNSVLTRLA